MVHYLDVRGGWDLKECECCFDRAVSLGAERVVTMESLDFVQSLLTKQVRDATPLAPRRDRGNGSGPTESMLEYALRVQAFGEQGEMAPRAQFSCKWPRMDTIWKAHVDVYDAVYPALASQLGAGCQEEEGNAASVLVQVLGLKESADLKEGFGFFVQHVLSGGLEKAHAHWRGKGGGGAGKKGPMSAGLMGQMGQPGQMGKVGEAMAAVMQSMQSGACMEPDEWLQIMHEYGVDMADMVAILGGDSAGGMGMGLPVGIGGGGRSGKDRVGGGDVKGEKWRGHLKGRVWERYVDGMAWILKHGVASVFSRREHRKLRAMFFASSQSASSSNVQDAAIDEARERLRKGMLTSGKLGKEGNERGATGGAVDAAAAAALAKGKPAPSVGISGTSSSGMLSPGLVPVNTDPTIGLLTKWDACILQWLRIYGSDSISAKNCFKDSRHGKVLPIRHPLRDLPSRLVRFGPVLPPLDGSTRLLEWEEWPEGDEAAMKFPEDSSARCFGLGRADGSRANSGNGEAQQGSFPEALLRHQNGESPPIVRCRADADLIVDFAGLFLEAPACAHCSQCITLYISHAPFVAFIANFAYRPAFVLLDRFLSVFKPRSEVFQSLLSRLGLDSSLNAPHNSQSDRRSSNSSSSVRALRERAELVPVAFLLSLALLCASPLLQQSGTEGGQNPRAGMGTSVAKEKAGGRRSESGASGEGMRGGKGGDGEEDSGVVWEEVQSWFTVAMLPASGMGEGVLACSGRMAGEEDEFAQVEGASEVYQCFLLPRFSEDMKQGDGLGGFSKRKAKKGEVLAYLKAWPGGVNMVACLREMLLGEPCYRPASAAVSSTPGAPTTGVAARTNAAASVSVTEASGAAACRQRVCGAAECGKVEVGGVKLRNCSGCGKVVYCGRECQKAYWPSHKLTCPGRRNSKKSGTNIGKVSGEVGRKVGSKVSGNMCGN
ncbi:unnamed protein product [Closterium sp. NIES-65]|nr:unnamed protein product [Closterium sp. NIES-65]